MVCTLEVNGNKLTGPVTELRKLLGVTTPEAVVRNTLLPEVVRTAFPQAGTVPPKPAVDPKSLSVKELSVNMTDFRSEVYHTHKLVVMINGVPVAIKGNWVSFTAYCVEEAMKELTYQKVMELNNSNGVGRVADLQLYQGIVPPKMKLLTVGDKKFVMRSPSAEEACQIADRLLRLLGRKAEVTFVWYGGTTNIIGRRGKITLG